MTSNDASASVFAIVLAAGSASRFGATKQLAEFDGEPLARRAMAVANSVCEANTLLVVGHEWRAVLNCCTPLQGFVVLNENYASGVGSSLAHAVRAVRHTAGAVVVLLADQVMVATDHVQALCDAWSGAANEIIATAYAGTTGAPVLFPHACFSDLIALSGDSGGRHLLSDARYRVREIEYEPAAVDIDTPEDLTRTSRSVRS